ncbi:Jouberin [Boothiomyces macroporosus]|uniref:Jouberin n=1 Tax=Boothiomyces macroporosus TaxID=261099 RepID=A0AAD5Y624_9FUNG|nr:Jouberin [Boothiomyces macroporosus]
MDETDTNRLGKEVEKQVQEETDGLDDQMEVDKDRPETEVKDRPETEDKDRPEMEDKDRPEMEEPKVEHHDKHKKKRKKKKKIIDPRYEALADKILVLKILKSDPLVPEMDLKHPMVKIHIVNIHTGQYYHKSSDRFVSSVYEQTNFILPILSDSFDLVLNSTKAPHWNQSILLNELYLHLVKPDVLILFEILDYLDSVKHMSRVCWAFLKIVGEEANTEKELRLQLYKYPFSLSTIQDFPVPYVYQCYKKQWHRYPSTFYIQIDYHDPIYERKTTNPELPLDREIGSVTIQELLKTDSVVKKESPYMSMMALNGISKQWKRNENEINSLPNKLLYRIETGSRGSFSCAFSNMGIFLAVGCVNTNSFPIKIYELETGKRMATLEGHLDLVYQLCWSQDDSELISASSDGSVRVWKFMLDGSCVLSGLYIHPTFVYSAIFHPTLTEPQYIATASYDGIIRIWEHSKKSEPSKKLRGHTVNVNTIVFSQDGRRIYSGDGSGILKIWSSEKLDGKKDSLNYECIKTIDTLMGHPIQHLQMHPSNRKLLVQTIGPLSHILDTRIHRFLSHFQVPLDTTSLPPTLKDNQFKITNQANSFRFMKSTFSACGTFLLSGSLKGTVHIWKTDTAGYVGSYSHKSLKSWQKDSLPIVDISFHPFDNYVAFSIWGDKEPISIYSYDESLPDMKTVESPEIVKTNHLDVDTIVAKSMANLFVDDKRKLEKISSARAADSFFVSLK